MLLGDAAAASRPHELLKTRYAVNIVREMANKNSSDTEPGCEVPRDADGRMERELEPDQRLVDVVLTELGLTDHNVKGAVTSRVKRSEDPVVDGREISVAENCRCGWLRCVCRMWVQTLPDIQKTTKCLRHV